MAKRDFYEVLGVNKNASQEEIKAAYKKAVKMYHPDLNPNNKEAEAKMKEVNEAYEILSDPDKRSKYDMMGHAAFDPTAQSSGFGGFSGFGGVEDIFESFFGGFSGFGSTRQRHNPNAPTRGRSLRFGLTISFEEAVFGTSKQINITREENCEKCGGSGAKEGTEPITCTRCNGRGTISIQQRTILGVMTSTQTCDLCGGKGKIVKEPCTSCRGVGRIKRKASIRVDIPAGIDSGQVIILHGQGEAGYNGGSPGDLHIEINVLPHKSFKRDGYHLYLDITIPFSVAALGGEVEVPTLEKPIKYKIPEGTQANTTFRLKDQGVPMRAGARGDLYVRIKAIEVPKNLTDEQKDLIRQLGEILNESVSANSNKKGRKRRKL